MTLLSDESKDYQDSSDCERIERNYGRPFSEEALHSREAVTGNVLNTSSPVYFGLDGVALDEQATSVIPVTPGSSRVTEPVSDRSEVAGYISHVRSLVKSSGIYALASLASPLVSLVLAPFLTRYLSRSDYGALAVLLTAIALITGVTQLGLGSAFFRAYNYDYESQDDRLSVLATVVILLSLVSIPIFIAMVLEAPSLVALLFIDPSLSDPFRLAALIILLQNLTVPGLSWLRAENRAVLYSTFSIANLLVTLLANIVLVGVLRLGIDGSLIATALGYAVVLVCTLPVIVLRAGFRARFDVAWGLLTFGLPNVSNFVSFWILQLSDRYLLSRLGSLSQTASYAVAYSLGGILSVVILSPFTLAWPSAMFAIAKKENAPLAFQLVFRWFSIVLLFAAFALSRISEVALTLLFPPAYHSAAPIISLIAMSMVFYGLYNVFCTGASIRRKNWWGVIFTTLAALINIGINLVLIPRYGSMGAALSTLIAYAVLALFAYEVDQWIYFIPFEIGLFFIAMGIGIALYIGSDLLARTQGRYAAWGIYLGALAFYGVCLVILGKLPTWSHRNNYEHTKENPQA